MHAAQASAAAAEASYYHRAIVCLPALPAALTAGTAASANSTAKEQLLARTASTCIVIAVCTRTCTSRVLAVAWCARLIIPLDECAQWSLCIAYHFVFVSISYVGILRFVEGVRLLLQHGTTNSTTDDRNGDSSEATQQQNSSTLAWSAAVRVLAQLKQMACSAEVAVQQQRKSDARQHSSSSSSSSGNSSSARRRAVRQTWEPGGAGASLIPCTPVEGGLVVLQQNGTSADAHSISSSSTQGMPLAAAAVAPLQESAALAAARAVHRQLYAQHCAVFKELLQWCCSSGATTADGGTAAA
eukprot:7598-Heterococcus_DN1.PRE.2